MPASPPPPPRGSAEASARLPSLDGSASDLATLLRAAGLDPATVDPAQVAALGQVLRVVVEGLMGALKARTEIKNQFRVAMTTLKPVDNNPLKFSVGADDALFNLFGRQNASFQSPVDAFRDAFDDLKAHQMAMMAGMRAAFTDLVNRFDPDQLQEGFDRGLKRSSILDVINKTKYWDLYREMYASFGDDDTTFRRLFGDEFAQAYEDQMQRLSALRKKR
jgi:type VI secretion system FHA domain protein